MKKLLVFLGVLCLLAILLVVTKPSKQACIDGIKEKIDAQITRSQNFEIVKTGAQAVSDFFIDRFGSTVFRIDDNTFYQDIYIKGIDQHIGIGILGIIIFTNKQNVQNEYEAEEAKTNVVTEVQNVAQDIKQGVHTMVQKVKNAFHKPNNPPSANIEERIEADSLAYIKAQEFHFGRLPAKKQQDIQDAWDQLQADRKLRQ